MFSARCCHLNGSSLRYQESKCRINLSLYCLSKLRSVGVSASLLAMFYNTAVCSAPIFGVVSWRGIISEQERGRVDKMVTKRGQVVGIRGQSIEEVYFRRVRCKLATVSSDSAHPLYSDVGSSRLEGSGRLRVPLEGTNPLKILFTPSAVSTCVYVCVPA